MLPVILNMIGANYSKLAEWADWSSVLAVILRSFVILSAAKDLSLPRARAFAEFTLERSEGRRGDRESIGQVMSS